MVTEAAGSLWSEFGGQPGVAFAGPSLLILKIGEKEQKHVPGAY